MNTNKNDQDVIQDKIYYQIYNQIYSQIQDQVLYKDENRVWIQIVDGVGDLVLDQGWNKIEFEIKNYEY